MQPSTTDSAPRRSALKWAIDLAMAVTVALLLNARVLGGLSFHETAGAVIGLVFGLHLYLNWSWVVGTTQRLLQHSLPPGVRFGYFLNWLLLVAMGVILVSGFLISRVLVPWMRVPNGRWIQGVHITLGFLVLAVVGIHVGLHWNWIASTTRRLVQRSPKSILVGIGLAALLLAGAQALQTSSPSPAPTPTSDIQRAAPPIGRDGPNENRPDRGDRAEHEARLGERHRGRSRGFGASGVWGVLGFYLGILSLFAFLTVLVERRLERRASRLSGT
jgi:hypothetical protein